MPGKIWTAQEEAELNALVEANLNVSDIAAKLKKTPKAVITKCERLGLQLRTEGYLNTSIPIPRELPSIEETLKMLAGAIKASVKPGLNRLEAIVGNGGHIQQFLSLYYMKHPLGQQRPKKP